MIEIRIKDHEIHAKGLIPGQDVLLEVNGWALVIHRHGDECHAHELKEEEENDK